MNLKQIEAFLKLANNGSFSLTAKELFLTQPTVTTHIQSLEEELNVKLFSRNTKGTNLTQDGEKLYLYAREIMSIVERINIEFKNIDEKSQKTLLISSSSIPASYILPNIVTNFTKIYNCIQFSIKESDSSKVIDDIINKRVDLGFTGTILDKKNCQYIPFYYDKLVIIMPNTKQYQNICEDKKNFSWIKDVPIIMREEGSGTRKEAEKFLKKHTNALSDLHIVAQMDNTGSIIRSVKSGLGISIVSELAARDYCNEDKLLIYPKILNMRKIYIVYNSTQTLSNITKLLIKFIENLYKEL